MNKKQALEFVSQDGRNLSKLNKQFRNDEEIVFKALDSTMPIFHFASQELRANEKIAKKALQGCIKNYNAIASNLKKNKDFTLFAIKIDANVFNEIPKELKSDEDIILASIKTVAHAVSYATELSLENPVFIKKLLLINGLCFQYLPLEMKNDVELLTIAIQEGNNKGISPFKYASNTIKNNKNYVFSLLKNEELQEMFLFLSFVSNQLKDDSEVVLKMVERHVQNYSFASQRIKDIVGVEGNTIDKLQVLFEAEKLHQHITPIDEDKKRKIKI
jgi:predicted RNA-binding protein Jag